MRHLYIKLLCAGIFLLTGCNLGTTPTPDASINTPDSATGLTDTPDSAPFSSVTQAVTVISSAATQDNTPQPASCTARTEWDTYTIVRGDNLTAIANKVRSTTAELIAANCLDNPDTIRVGQTLYVPSVSNNAASNNNPQNISPALSGRNRIYIDESGFALDYPAEWILTKAANNSGGGLVANYRFDEIPAAAAPWPDAFIGVQFTPFSENTVGDDLQTWAQNTLQDYDEASRIEVIGTLQAVTLTSGLEGYVFATEGAGAPTRHYFLDIAGQFVIFEVTGKSSPISDTVINSIRPA